MVSFCPVRTYIYYPTALIHAGRLSVARNIRVDFRGVHSVRSMVFDRIDPGESFASRRYCRNGCFGNLRFHGGESLRAGILRGFCLFFLLYPFFLIQISSCGPEAKNILRICAFLCIMSCVLVKSAACTRVVWYSTNSCDSMAYSRADSYRILRTNKNCLVFDCNCICRFITWLRPPFRHVSRIQLRFYIPSGTLAFL